MKISIIKKGDRQLFPYFRGLIYQAHILVNKIIGVGS